MNEIQFRQLLDDYVTGKLSDAEQRQLFEHLEDEQNRIILEQTLEQEWKEGRYEQEENEKIYRFLEKSILARINEVPPVPDEKKHARFFSIGRFRLAAAVILLFVTGGVGIWFFSKSRQATNQPVATRPVPKKEIGPGTEGAILTLNNGQRIILDSIHNGLVTEQGGSSIIKQQAGLQYQAVNVTGDVPVYNTISTPRGRQYPNLVLSDGTRVWLDAESSIRFPVAFIGNERKVEISGQVWFDVVHDAQKPFKVIAKGIEVTDIGTQFNVKAYDDENPLRVTLLQGIIRVKDRILSPGEQAQILNNGSLVLDKNADLAEVSAWKDGRFLFNGADIQQVMRELARWYDLEVTYTNDIKEKFHLEITRNTNLSSVLKILQETGGVHFKIEGKKIIVMP